MRDPALNSRPLRFRKGEWIALCAALLLGLGVPGCQTTPPKPPTALQMSLEALEKTGVKAYEEGRFESALRLFGEAASLARSTDNRIALANAFNNQGAVLKEMGEAGEAAEILEEALRLNEALKLDGARAINLANLAALEIDRPKGNLSRAKEYNRRAEALFREAGNPLGSLLVRNNEGRILLCEGKVEKAREVFEDALSDADDEESARLRAVILANRGKTFEVAGDLTRALRDYREALALERELEVFTGVARTLESMARVQIRRGDKGEAAKTLLRALDVALLRIRWEPWVGRLLASLEKLLKELGRAKEASDLRSRVREDLEHAKKEAERLKRLRTEEPMGDLD